VAPELRAADLDAVREQLGREPTVAFEVVARCGEGHPLAIRNAPIDQDGRPFPTTYWLTCPEAVRRVATLESEGWIARLNERAASDLAFGEALAAAHREAAADRAGGPAPTARDAGGVGGTRRGIKCLHAHYANRLGGGDDPVGAWVADRVEPVHPSQRPGRLAVVDQGTNSTRLLVLEPPPVAGGEAVELARDLVITRLGQGLDASGRIAPDALDRVEAVLTRYVRRSRALGAERIRVGATAVARDAANAEDVRRLIRTVAGVEPEVIEGEHEAALSFLGATRGLDPALAPYLVLDIGGGSTELVLGRRPGTADAAVSTRLGSVRLTERLVHSDPPSVEDRAAVRAAADAVLAEAESDVPIEDARTFVAVGGTATTLQAIALGLPRYDPDRIHRTWLARDDAAAVLEDLAGMSNAERAAIPVMAPGRGDVIVAGAEILLATMRRFGFDRALASETDILDGLALELVDVG
jgi:exopolyphosphatase/guanosine-5'-triphosphate,3'-diphosphate pyrophosphatase